MTTGRQGGEVVSRLPREASSTRASQGTVAQIEPELGVLCPDEVEHREIRLAVGQAQAASKLLQEDRRTLSGPQQQDRVNSGKVHALVEQVDGEENPQRAIRELRPRANATGWVVP